MKKHHCALFDLDGVVVDTAKYHYLAWKKIASEVGYELTHQDNEQLKVKLGNAVKKDKSQNYADRSF